MSIAEIAGLAAITSGASLTRIGAQLFERACASLIPEILHALEAETLDRPGVRLTSRAAAMPILGADGVLGRIAATAIGAGARPVRAILFDKSEQTNWSLAWHQDRTIAVKHRLAVEGFGPWTVKAGMQHVAPPFDLLSRMVTLRAHLDDVPADNAPLLIAPGSHCAGRVSEDSIDAVVRQCGVMACLANAGDVWLYATPILHASERAARPTRRRVLQVDYAAEDLPGGLEWLGV